MSHVEGGGEGDYAVITLEALLSDEATPSELGSFKQEGLEMVRLNKGAVALSTFMETEEGPVAIFYFEGNYSLEDRTQLESWLRQHRLVRRITFQEDVSGKARKAE